MIKTVSLSRRPAKACRREGGRGKILPKAVQGFTWRARSRTGTPALTLGVGFWVLGFSVSRVLSRRQNAYNMMNYISLVRSGKASSGRKTQAASFFLLDEGQPEVKQIPVCSRRFAG